VFIARHDFGVINRGGTAFLLKYYAKTGPQLGQPAWNLPSGKKSLKLDLVPSAKGDQISVKVLWQGKPLEGAEYTVARPGKGDVEGKTRESGVFTFAAGEPRKSATT